MTAAEEVPRDEDGSGVELAATAVVLGKDCVEIGAVVSIALLLVVALGTTKKNKAKYCQDVALFPLLLNSKCMTFFGIM